MRKSFIVQVDLPDGCTVADMREYITEAVRAWNGRMDPNEPLFNLDRSSVKVTQLPTVGDD